MTTATKTEKQQQIEYAREALDFIQPGDRITVITDYTSSARQCRVFAANGREVRNITFNTVRATSGRKPRENKNGWYISMGGGGYSAAQEIVSQLSYALFGDVDALRYEEV